MEATVSRVDVPRPLPPEEAGRADFYALLAALFHHGPDARLLGTLAIAEPLDGGDPALAAAWSSLCEASAAMDPEAAAAEYESLFVGVGKAKVSIYAGFHGGAGGAQPQRVRLIEDLAALGLAFPAGRTLPEDHYAGLLDTMRVLVAGGAGRGPAGLPQQRAFFETHIAPGIGRFLAAVAEAPESNYYRKVAALAQAFVRIEIESFNLG